VTYIVVWDDSVLAEVAAEWVRGADKVQIMEASRQIDVALGADPIGNGEALEEGMFYIDRAPLRAVYTIEHDLQRVKVGRIRRLGSVG
jgi:hypothetical protein